MVYTTQAQTREELQQQAEQYRTNVYKAFTVFLNAGETENTRIKAVSGYPAAIDAKQLQQCVIIAGNTQETDAIRATALQSSRPGADANPDFFNNLLQWITDEKYPLLRAAAFDKLELITFGSIAGPQMSDVLKELLTDENHDYRIRALGMLLNSRDEYVQQLIIRNIISPDTSLFTLDESLGCLFVFPKFSNELYASIYKIMNTEEVSVTTKATCIRLIGSYQPAQEQILSIYQNTGEQKELRIAALNNLQVSQQDKLRDYLSPVIFNENENENMRIMSIELMKYLEQRTEIRAKQKRPDKFSMNIASLAETTKSDAVRNAADDYVLNVNTKY